MFHVRCALPGILACLLLWHCNTTDPLPEYTPPVVFEGIINDTLLTMPGSYAQPNECYIDDGTIIMKCGTKDYRPAGHGLDTATGRFLRIHILPDAHDSLLHITEKECIVHYFDPSYAYGTQTYEITPADSTNPAVAVQMTPARLSPHRRGRIELTEISAHTAGKGMVISQGHISGRIQY